MHVRGVQSMQIHAWGDFLLMLKYLLKYYLIDQPTYQPFLELLCYVY